MILKPPKGTLLNRQHPLARGLVGCWLLNENGGTFARDVFNSHFTTWVTASSGTLTWQRSGINFDSASTKVAYITCASPKLPALGTGPYTILLGVWPDALKACGVLAFGSYHPAFCLDATGHPYIYDLGGHNASNTALSTGVRSHIAYVRYGTGTGQTAYYVNGLAAGTCTHSESIGAPTTLTLGSDRNASSTLDFTGNVSYAMIYRRALSASEVRAFSMDPYCMFRRPRVELWSAATQGAGAPPETPAGQYMSLNKGWW